SRPETHMSVWHDCLYRRLSPRRLRALSTISRRSTGASGSRRGSDVSTGPVDHSGHFQRFRKSPGARTVCSNQRHRRDHRKHRWRSSHTAQPCRSCLEADLLGQPSNRYFGSHSRVPGSPALLSDMDLFKHRSFTVGMPLVILIYLTTSGFFFSFVLFLQSGLGFSPLNSGLSFAVINAGFIAASLLGPRLIPRLGNRILSFAYALQAAGLVWTLFTVTSSGTGLTLSELAAPLVIFGLGAGFALSPLLGIILSGVPSQDVGAASGVVSTSIQIGNTVGISLFGLLFYRFLSSQLSSTPVSYLDSFKLTLPFLIVPSLSSFIIVFFLSQHRARQIIHTLEA